MAVGSDRLEAQLPAIEEHADPVGRPSVAALKQVVARVGKGAGGEEVAGWHRRQPVEGCSTRAAQQPAPWFGVRARPRLHVGPGEEHGTDAEEGARITGAAQVEDVAVV